MNACKCYIYLHYALALFIEAVKLHRMGLLCCDHSSIYKPRNGAQDEPLYFLC